MSKGMQCLGCTKRYVGCHAVCKEYLDWKAARNKKYREIMEGKVVEAQISGYESSKKKKLTARRPKNAVFRASK